MCEVIQLLYSYECTRDQYPFNGQMRTGTALVSVNARRALTAFQQVIMTLVKLRLNLPVQDLAYRFGTSTSTISCVFTLKRLHFLLRWPTREELRSTMPI